MARKLTRPYVAMRNEALLSGAAVLIFVDGGVADWLATPRVQVALIDTDNIEAGDKPPKLSGRLLAMAREARPDDEGTEYIA